MVLKRTIAEMFYDIVWTEHPNTVGIFACTASMLLSTDLPINRKYSVLQEWLNQAATADIDFMQETTKPRFNAIILAATKEIELFPSNTAEVVSELFLLSAIRNQEKLPDFSYDLLKQTIPVIAQYLPVKTLIEATDLFIKLARTKALSQEELNTEVDSIGAKLDIGEFHHRVNSEFLMLSAARQYPN